jgi:LuxR family transcriptional regulator
MKVKSNNPGKDPGDLQSILFNLHHKIKKQEVRLEDIGDYMPGSVMVQDLKTLANTYMNKKGCEFLRHSSEELANLGPEYYERFFPKEETEKLKGTLQQFLINNDHSATCSFFQRVRPDRNVPYQWYFTTSQFYPAAEQEESGKLMHVAIAIDDTSQAARIMNYICEQDEFVTKHYAKFRLLSKREKEIIKLIVDGKSSYYISEVLFISMHTVNNHRKNICRKLEVKSLSELIRFAIAYFIM